MGTADESASAPSASMAHEGGPLGRAAARGELVAGGSSAGMGP